MKGFHAMLVLLLFCAGVQAAAGETYNYIDAWGDYGSGDGQLWGPHGIAVDTAGNVYVSEQWNERVQRFTPVGQFVAKWGSEGTLPGQFKNPEGIAVDYLGNVYVVDTGNCRVQVFTATGAWLRSFGSYGSGDGQLDLPDGIALDSAGKVYVADTGNSRVQVFSSNGIFLGKWGSEGSADGQLLHPLGIAVGQGGVVYVADTANHRVQMFTTGGAFLGKWGGRGSADGQFIQPTGIAVDSEGSVYVADYGNNRVQKFSSTGQFITDWSGRTLHMGGIAVDTGGTVYLVDYNGDRVMKFAPALEPDFTTVPAFGGVPLTVQFTDTTTNGLPQSWTWNFGDGQTSQLRNPSHTYTTPGTYDVTLTVSSTTQGTSTKTREDCITALPVLDPAFTARPLTGYEPLTVQFTDATTGGQPDSWTWNFGDGTISHLRNPGHTYTVPGTYDVTLTVTNTASGSRSETRADCVRVLPLWNGLIRVEAEDFDPGRAGEAYFDTTSGNSGGAYRATDVDIRTFGTSGYVVTETEEGEWTRYTVFSQKSGPFTYPLSLRVDASDRGRSIEIWVNNGHTAAATVSVPSTLWFTWANTTVVLEPGENTLEFLHRDRSTSGIELEFDFFTLNPAVVPLAPNFTAAPRTGYAPLTVQFTDATTGSPVSWFWDFGDGMNSTQRNPSHTYTGDGPYTVSLTVTNAGSDEASATKTGFVRVIPVRNGLIQIQAEDYDEGGEGVSYHDLTAGNSGGAYRLDEDVDIIALTPDGYAVSDAAGGEWTQYTVPSEKPGTFSYPLAIHARASGAGRSIEVAVNGHKAGSFPVPSSSDFAWVNTTVDLSPGENVIRFIHRDASTTKPAPDLEFDCFSLDTAGVVVTPTPTPPAVLAVPPGADLPTDTDGDGVYDDVNGNGRKDFADVVLYFNQMTWIAQNEPASLFDYNGNGRIDFADVVWLFNHL